MRHETPSQTAGPYVHIGLLPAAEGLRGIASDFGAAEKTTGNMIDLTGRILDGAGMPVTDAIVECWQPSSWQRVAADPDTGQFHIRTHAPEHLGQGEARHLAIWIVARGLNNGLLTRIYFDDMQTDPVLAAAGSRAATMIAKRTADGWHHEIHLQGPRATVFLQI